MKDFFLKLRGLAAVAAVALAAMLPSDGALAQAVQQLPVYVNINTVVDIGNGPQDILSLQGNAWMFTEQGAGLSNSSNNSTTIVLTALPASPPCVGCLLTQTGNNAAPNAVTSVTVISYNGVTSLTVSSALTLGANTPLAWGSACPSYSSINGLAPTPNIALQAQNTALPMYTLARICTIANNGPGATILPFAISAH